MNHLLTRDVQWYKRTGTQANGQSKFDSPVAVKVRRQRYPRRVVNAQGEVVYANTKYFCDCDISPGDLIVDGDSSSVVLAVYDLVRLNGEVMVKEVYV